MAEEDESRLSTYNLSVLAARNLAKKDWFSDSDPYVKIHVTMQDMECDSINLVGKTAVIKNNLNPIWLEHFTVKLDPDINVIVLELWDENRLTKDDFLGRAILSPETCFREGF